MGFCGEEDACWVCKHSKVNAQQRNAGKELKEFMFKDSSQSLTSIARRIS